MGGHISIWDKEVEQNHYMHTLLELMTRLSPFKAVTTLTRLLQDQKHPSVLSDLCFTIKSKAQGKRIQFSIWIFGPHHDDEFVRVFTVDL